MLYYSNNDAFDPHRQLTGRRRDLPNNSQKILRNGAEYLTADLFVNSDKKAMNVLPFDALQQNFSFINQARPFRQLSLQTSLDISTALGVK